MPRYVDLSHPLSAATPPFPGDPAVEISINGSTTQVDRSPRKDLNCCSITTSVHGGTHMDAPYHFYGDGVTIDQVDLSACVGPAVLVDLCYLDANAEILPTHLELHADALRRAQRCVLHTGWWRRWTKPEYFTDHPVLSGEVAAYLVSLGVQLVGVDFPSVDQPPFPAHLELLGNGVLIVENLTGLDQIDSESFELITTPLAITGRDGSPVRAVARME